MPEVLKFITVRRGALASAYKFPAARTFPIQSGTGGQPYAGICVVHFSASASNMTLGYLTLKTEFIEFFIN